MILLHNCQVLTMENETLIKDGALLFDPKGDRIEWVGAWSDREAVLQSRGLQNVETIDLGGRFVMPGMINAHIHFTMKRTLGSVSSHASTATLAFRAVRAALRCLQAGVTAARDMGHIDHVHAELPGIIENGTLPGPRIKQAPEAIVMNDGHAYFFCRNARTTDEVVAYVRQQINQGADFIKIIASHDDLPFVKGPEVCISWFPQEGLVAAARLAHAAGIPITAHANGNAAIRQVIEAGFDHIEHGIYINAENARLMRERNMILIPTLTGYKQNSDPSWRRDPAWTKRYAALWQAHAESFRNAVEAGVKLAAGTDTLGDLVEEVELFVSYGLSPFEALRTVTCNAAEVLGMQDEIGTLAVGKRADMVVLDANPLEDVSALRQVHLVIKAGRVFDPRSIAALLPPSPDFRDE